MSMPIFDVELVVTPRQGVRDPQGEAVQEALHNLGHDQVEVGCVGRVLRLRVPAPDRKAVTSMVESMCEELLVNPCLETFHLRIEPASAKEVA